MKTQSVLNSYVTSTVPESTTLVQSSSSKTCEKGTSEKASDMWCGVARERIRSIEGTPFFLSRTTSAVPDEGIEQRFNAHGYDMDDPKDAIAKYEAKHPVSIGTKIAHFFSDILFNVVTVGIPALLSLSAGKNKQRIDQKVVLRVVREAVDKFPELKIRISKEAFDRLDAADQRMWHEKMSIVRAAQHDYIANELARVYPHHINLDAPTILYTGGRATGLLRVLYCSMDEYVGLYWSDWGLMSADSGAYHSHVYDYITEGHNVNWNARYLDYKPRDYEVTEPGEFTFLGENDRKIWSFDGPCGMVDHGIGDIPSMFKMPVLNTVTTTLNMHSIGTFLSTQVQAVAHEYWQRMKDACGVSEISVTPISCVSEIDLKSAQDYFARILERAK